MRKSAKALIAGAAALVCAGGVYAAAQDMHVLKVAMPDGSIAQIHYVGDVAPKVEVVPGASSLAMIGTDMDAPFAMLDRMAADMDRQQAEMMQRVVAMQAQAANSADMRAASSSSAPQGGGVYHYTFVATTNGNGGCTQRYELTSYGDKEAPKEISQQSGDCRGVAPLVKTSAPATPLPPKATPTAAKAPAPARISPDSI